MITVSMAIEDKTLWTDVHSCLESELVQIDSEQSHVENLRQFLGSLGRSKPDIALIDVTALQEPPQDAIRKIRAAAPGSMIVCLNTVADAAMVLECFRAGADDYLFPPLEDGLKKALASRQAQHSQVDNHNTGGRIALFIPAAGGCGATTMACHVAHALSCLEQRVLLADLSSGGIVSFLMKSSSPYCFADAVNNVHRLDASYWKALVSSGKPNLEIISAPTGLADIGDAERIRQVLSFTRTQYQWTIADAGTCTRRSTMAALEAADEVYLITMPEIPALHQTKQTMQKLLDVGYNQDRLHLILNRVPRGSRIRPEEIQAMLGIPLYAVFPENCGELYEAWSQGRLLPPGSELGKSMERLARKMAGLVEKRTGRLQFFR